MLGILVHGDNHFIISGPLPSYAAARRLVRLWEMPQLGTPPPQQPRSLPWTIVTKAFRENLEWAVALEGDRPAQPAVAELLEQIAARGVIAHRGAGPLLPPGDSGWRGGVDWPPDHR